MPVQNKAQQIGRAGERWFAQQLPTNWIIQPPHEDVGIDGVVVISEDSPSNGLEFRVQIKSSLSWHSSADSISLRVKRANLTYWLTGFTPTLLVLYDAQNNVGYCSWINQLIFDDTSKLERNAKTVTLQISKSQKIDDTTWGRISLQLAALNRRIARRVAVSGMAIPVLESIHSLMQSLYLIDLCAFNWPPNLVIVDSKVIVNEFDQAIDYESLQDLVRAETTAHKEIAQSLLILDRRLTEAGVPSTGANSAAKKYIDTCTKFIDNFAKFIQQGPSVQMNININAMFEYRAQAVREVTQIVSRLSSLALSVAREGNTPETQ